jgi:hypothetical protein
MRTTEWHRYGTESGNPKCANCMVHSGYEASAVNDTFGSLRGFWATVLTLDSYNKVWRRTKGEARRASHVRTTTQPNSR